MAEKRVNYQVQRVLKRTKEVKMMRAAAVRGLGAKGDQAAAVNVALDDRAMVKMITEMR